jgi:hypothetical protein
METYKTTAPFLYQKSGGKKIHMFGKKQIIVDDGEKVHVQGRRDTYTSNDLLELISLGKIEKCYVSEEFIYENVIPSSDYLEVCDILSKAKKIMPHYQKHFKTIETWVFLPKGSNASKIMEEIGFQNNREIVLGPTNLRGGIKSKPGDVHMNRGTNRHGPCVTKEDSELWLLDESTILPYGIRESDYASQSEQVKIFKKLIQQICSMEDCPLDFKDFFFTKMGILANNEPFKDYLPLIDIKSRQNLGYPNLLFSDFDKNQHHSKEKGLELCHLDPWMEFPTNIDNITIGSSRANRQQGGYPLWHHKQTFQ